MFTTSTLASRDRLPARFFEPGSALRRVLLHSPYLPRCSDDKTARLVRPRQYALQQPYMQVNAPGMVSWLIFDLDHPNSWGWDDAGLPAPNLIVRDRVSGRSHLFYAIVPVCTSQAGRTAPVEYLRAVREALCARLRADPLYPGGPVARTPGHPRWDTTELHARQYSLGFLAEHVTLVPRFKVAAEREIPRSRHCLLFEDVRQFAYRIVDEERRLGGSLESFALRLEAFAHGRNRYSALGFAADLPASSIRATVRSVSRWTWSNYTPSVRRGVMQLDPTLPLSQRQRLAAERTHGLRRERTAAAIVAARERLLRAGQSPSQAALARECRLSRQTVAMHRDALDRPALTPPEAGQADRPRLPPPSVPLASTTLPQQPVKHAVHQITGTARRRAFSWQRGQRPRLRGPP